MGVSRVESELYSTVLNGQTSKTWPEPHLIMNEIKFRLPSSLNLIDEIEITGTMIPNPERLLLNLITGTSSPDYENIACQLDVNFLTQKTILKCIENEEDVNQSPSDLFPDSEFKFIIKVEVEEQILEITIGASTNRVELKHNLKDITYLTLSNDTTKVDELKFRYA